MNWREVSLKQICNVDWGNTKLTKSSYVENGKFLAVSAAGADGMINHYEHEANVAVLSAIGAQCGRMFFPGQRFTAIKNTITLTPKVDLSDGKFLYYLFTFVELPQRGAGQPFISKGDIEAFRVLIPESLQEQREIVEKLDCAFAEIELIEGNLELSDQKISQLWQSLLSLAFNPEHSSDNESNLFAHKGTAKKIVKLGEVVEIFNGSTPLKTNQKYWIDGDVPWFTIDDLRKQGKYIYHTEKFITKLGLAESSITLLPENAILLCCTASVGAIAINKIPLTTNQQFNALVVKDPKQLLVEFLYYWFLANIAKLKSLGRATTIEYVSMSKLRDINLQLPSIEKQKEIIDKLEKAFAEIESLRSQLRKKKDIATALRQSLLITSFTQEKTVA
jgi:restriction endonuclease S subunit